MSEKEYDKYFTKFYGDLFKFRNGSKNNLTCKGCKQKKDLLLIKIN